MGKRRARRGVREDRTPTRDVVLNRALGEPHMCGVSYDVLWWREGVSVGTEREPEAKWAPQEVAIERVAIESELAQIHAHRTEKDEDESASDKWRRCRATGTPFEEVDER